MEKLAYFFIDDVIWCFRDVARQRPKSLFDNTFFSMLKKGHDEYGMTVQLNLFYRTDFFYGDDEFTLSEMPDDYRQEFEASKDWLRLAFHAKQEFPDYPYVNATYEDVKRNYEAIINEIIRFAGEGSVAHAVVPHWLPISKEGCKALADCGVKFVSPSTGERRPFDGNNNSLPFGHAGRLLQNRQPETMLFTRNTKSGSIASSICAYNHISDEQKAETLFKQNSILDKYTGLRFKMVSGGPCLNQYTYEEIESRLRELAGNEYIGTGVHEQYFYPDYFAYQPDYAEKLYLLGRVLSENGYRFITADEMK